MAWRKKDHDAPRSIHAEPEWVICDRAALRAAAINEEKDTVLILSRVAAEIAGISSGANPERDTDQRHDYSFEQYKIV